MITIMMAFSRNFNVRSIVPAAAASIWLLLAGQASGGAIASWWTDLGPSMLVQDDESAGLRYSLCNSNVNPILPEDKTITVPLYQYPPKNGTTLAGVGWYDGSTTWVSFPFRLDICADHTERADTNHRPQYSTRIAAMISSTRC